MLCDLFANAQKALVLDNDTSMFPYHFVIVKVHMTQKILLAYSKELSK